METSPNQEATEEMLRESIYLERLLKAGRRRAKAKAAGGKRKHTNGKMRNLTPGEVTFIDDMTARMKAKKYELYNVRAMPRGEVSCTFVNLREPGPNIIYTMHPGGMETVELRMSLPFFANVTIGPAGHNLQQLDSMIEFLKRLEQLVATIKDIPA